MSHFSGPGTLTLNGSMARIYDCQIDAPLIMAGTDQIARAIEATDVTIEGLRTAIVESWIDDLHVDSGAPDVSINNNRLRGEVTVAGNGASIEGNTLDSITDALVVSGDDVAVKGNTFSGVGSFASDTYDCLRIEGDRCLVTGGNKFIPAVGDTRSAVNVVTGATDTRIAGNDLGDAADYGTDKLINNGTGTELTFPADATYGDNW